MAVAEQPRRIRWTMRGLLLLWWLGVVTLNLGMLWQGGPTRGFLVFAGLSAVVLGVVTWLADRVDAKVEVADADLRVVRMSGRRVRIALDEVRVLRRFRTSGGVWTQQHVDALRIVGPRRRTTTAAGTMDGYRELEDAVFAALPDTPVAGPSGWDRQRLEVADSAGGFRKRVLYPFVGYLQRRPEHARIVMVVVGAVCGLVGVAGTGIVVGLYAAPASLSEALRQEQWLAVVAVSQLAGSVAIAGFFLWVARLLHRAAKGDAQAQGRLRAAVRRTRQDE